MTRSATAVMLTLVTWTLAAAPARAADDLLAAAVSLITAAPGDAPAAGWAPADSFNAEAWTLQTYVSGTVGDEDHGNMYAAHVGVGYFLKDNLSVNLDFLAGRVDTGPVSGDDDGIVGGFDLLFRWHFVQRERWSFYLDGGCGFQLADTNFPSDSHHNFRPQLGVGLTYLLRDRLHLLAGVRYLHISNARTTDGNDGLDGAMLYTGAMWGF